MGYAASVHQQSMDIDGDALIVVGPALRQHPQPDIENTGEGRPHFERT